MKFIATLWNTLKRPPVHISLGVIILVSFIAGVIFWGGFNTAMEVTNTEKFCVSCHEMEDNVYQELQETIHWSNRTGVRAICSDCHVPHDWTAKIARKMQASKEVWGAIFGTIDTPEKFEEKRLELAQHEWARFKANGSKECRSCHDYDSMDWERMSDEARRFMKPAAERDQSCLDCHKGIAHHLPEDMNKGGNPMLAKLVNNAVSVDSGSDEAYYSAESVDLYRDAELDELAGQLTIASEVTVEETRGDSVRLNIPGWRKEKGFGRVLYEDFGQNIESAILDRDVAQDDALIDTGEQKVDELTGLPWARVNVELWAKKGAYVDRRDALWDTASQIYHDGCSVCHTEPDPGHFDANTWPAMFSGMVGFTNMDGPTQSLVLKYLQKHSSDYVQDAQAVDAENTTGVTDVAGE
ncbi:pentaheme c-type cytochrome TorC [Halomonas piscis]|uniref:Cytochrome c-type protein n=1 Tax=Halomonas piscis TaxID=3031727 RepID=A0ABY9Z0Q8_9GAMM|nr:pentaheme c-type cytochrome TorC [Halomonas piscis]WNK20724.1 pentaheme c-type cytochrome TorC [Halomonas piscis]